MDAFRSIEAEMTLIASALNHAEAYHQAAAAGVRAEDFSLSEHREIYQQVMTLGEAGDVANADAVIASIHNPHVKSTVLELASPLNLPRRDVSWQIRTVLDKSRRRQLVSTCERLVKTAEDASETTEDCLGFAQDWLLEIQATQRQQQAVHTKEFLPELFCQLRNRALKEGLIGMSTGNPDLDEATTGIRPGELWAIGALPGRGKTSLGIEMALANVASGTPVAFFSLEMSREELGARILSADGSIAASRIRNPRYMGQSWEHLANRVTALSEQPLYVDDSPSLKLSELLARARLYIRRLGTKLIIVDYLRLVDSPGKEIRERVGNVANGLRQLAKSEKVGVVALSQLTRPKDHNINARPTMLDFKESGDVEAHIHVGVLIYMPIKDDEPTGEDELIIGKNRHGVMGSIPVMFSKDRLQFMPRVKEAANGY